MEFSHEPGGPALRARNGVLGAAAMRFLLGAQDFPGPSVMRVYMYIVEKGGSTDKAAIQPPQWEYCVPNHMDAMTNVSSARTRGRQIGRKLEADAGKLDHIFWLSIRFYQTCRKP